jgi:ribosomal protein S18 acetylase RimI-like enzyme
MIRELNNKHKETAEKILAVQLPAYKVEAELMNFDGIPQLQDTVNSIIQSNETFVGYLIEDVLAGFISYTNDEDFFQICRLVVNPYHFRKGIAKRLLGYLIEHVSKECKATVTTGAKNVPAKNLYKIYGFHEVKDIEVAPNVFITLLSNHSSH